MTISLLLEMAAETLDARVAVVDGDERRTYGQLRADAERTAAWLTARAAETVGYVGANGLAFPTLLFAAAFAGRVFAPLNYRLADVELRRLAERLAPASLLVDDAAFDRLRGIAGVECTRVSELGRWTADLDAASRGEPASDAPAVMLYTSGTSGDAKAVLLRHRHLVSYVTGTIDFGSAGAEEAALVSVPPYHIAGVMSVLSSVFAGRRTVLLPSFDPDAWVAGVESERVTHAMVVPTMLGRILDSMERSGSRLESLRHLAYGGGRMPVPVLERAMALLPTVDFVNAYGLTETSSTIAVLGPEDHRSAIRSEDASVRRRLGSVGRPLPTVEIEIRDELGTPLLPGERGEIWVRGEQIAGEYLAGNAVASGGWFQTNDGGFIDVEGYLFLDGRLDDVIVRGGENLSPAEIEDVLHEHAAVADAVVVGVPDREWGEAVLACVVLHHGAQASESELRAWVAERLRSTRAPARIEFWDELPYGDTGKLLRRVVRDRVRAAT